MTIFLFFKVEYGKSGSAKENYPLPSSVFCALFAGIFEFAIRSMTFIKNLLELK